MDMEKEILRYDFAELSIEDKQRVYSFCWANEMMLAEFVNEQNAKMKSAYRVTFIDIQKQLAAMSDEDRAKLDAAYKIMMDYEAKRRLPLEQGNYALKLVEKLHPSYAKKSEVKSVDTVRVLVEHLDKASKMCGYDKEIIRKEIVKPDVEEIEYTEKP